MAAETWGIFITILVIAGFVAYVAYNLGLSHGHRDVAEAVPPAPTPAPKPVASIKRDTTRTQKK